MSFRLFVLGALALGLSACQTARGTREPVLPYPPAETPSPAGVPGPVLLPQQPEPPPATLPQLPVPVPPPASSQEPVAVAPPLLETRPQLPAYARNAEEMSGAAVVSLLRQARSASTAGKPQQAQAALERALRIEPRNYFIWTALAGSYLDQRNYAQAISVAKKSNSLARGNIYAEYENCRVIAAASDALGDSAAGLQAQARMDEIQRLLQSAAD